MKVYIDQSINQTDIKILRTKYEFEIVQEHDTEQHIKIATQVAKAFTIGSNGSYMSREDFIPGDDFEKIQKIIGRENNFDISHLYSAYVANCKYFLTENKNDFIRYFKKRKRHRRQKNRFGKTT